MNARPLAPEIRTRILAIAAVGILGTAIVAATGIGDDMQTRAIQATEDFHRIYVEGPATLHIHQGEEARVEVAAAHEHQDTVEVEVSDATLFIDVPAELEVEDVVVQVTTRQLTELYSAGPILVTGGKLRTDTLVVENRGSGDYRLASLDADELIIEARGAFHFEVDGRADRQVVEMAGAGAYEADGLESRTAEVRLKGAGSARVWATERLDVDIAGAGSVAYAGDPDVHRRIRGFGTVQKINQ
ncbi:MAG: DUF2807 domain-containing protein [Gammaproteobacteria bacterium]|nr:DUF2807 domain-containing protein [Gammaproteobacteria bacterium]